MSFVAKGMSEMTQDARFVGMLWGPVGAGKTPMAATAPGRVTYLMFDTDGWKTIAHLKHVDVIDLSGESDDIVDRFERGTDVEANLKAFLTDETASTLVLDSVTSLMDRALARGIVRAGPYVTKGQKPSNIAPGLQGYGARGMLVRRGILNLHSLCARYNKHFIATAHEKQDMNSDGSVEAITMLLGGEAYVQVPKNFSEIWRLENKGATTILVRPFNKYVPCRTRMFKTEGPGIQQFPWRFNTYDWTGEGIETWMTRWKEAGCQAIPLPR